ncbi:MAG: hypothetical protein IPG64_20285 [Haliea sp.]|nr:hypothetical protein [Haliea sp.]
MKRVLKQLEPIELTRFRNAVPQGTWQQMRDDANFGGPAASNACRAHLLADQGGICGFCEIAIHDNDPLKCRVEHFHPKSDISLAHNWALDWNNQLGVCAGGSHKSSSVPYTQEPLAQNLSCDAYKDRMIQSGRLPAQCEGWILNPIELIATPCLFQVEKSTGKLLPDPANCAVSPPWPGNQHVDVCTLAQYTIDMLNLNCDRLCQARITIVRDIEHNKKDNAIKGSLRSKA